MIQKQQKKQVIWLEVRLQKKNAKFASKSPHDKKNPQKYQSRQVYQSDGKLMMNFNYIARIEYQKIISLLDNTNNHLSKFKNDKC